MASNASRLVLGGFYDTILVRYVGEIGIKSEKVRRRLKDRLAKCITNQLSRKQAPGFSLSVTHARIFLSIEDPRDIAAVHELLQRIPGIHSFSYCKVLPIDLPVIHERAVALARLLLDAGKSFAVRVTREGTHPFTSQSLARDLGSSIHEALGDLHVTVDLTKPDVTVHVEVRDGTALLYHETHDGFGGMPRDVSSPVLGCVGMVDESWEACQRVIKRGSNVHLVLTRWVNENDGGANKEPGRLEVDDIVRALNADSRLVERVFHVLDMQEENLVRITVVPLHASIATLLERAGIPAGSRVIASFLGMAVPAFMHARVFTMSAGAPRKSMDFKAIVSEWSCVEGQEGTNGTLHAIQAMVDAITRMVPKDVPPLPLLFPLVPTVFGQVPEASGVITATPDPCVADVLLEMLRHPASRDEFRSVLERAVDQRRVVRFDMIERRFLSRR